MVTTLHRLIGVALLLIVALDITLTIGPVL